MIENFSKSYEDLNSEDGHRIGSFRPKSSKDISRAEYSAGSVALNPEITDAEQIEEPVGVGPEAFEAAKEAFELAKRNRNETTPTLAKAHLRRDYKLSPEGLKDLENRGLIADLLPLIVESRDGLGTDLVRELERDLEKRMAVNLERINQIIANSLDYLAEKGMPAEKLTSYEPVLRVELEKLLNGLVASDRNKHKNILHSLSS